jgi:hypothetical protein
MVAAVATGAMLGVALHSLGVGQGTGTGPLGEATDVAAQVASAVLERQEGVPGAAVEAGEAGVLWVESAGCGIAKQASATAVRDGERVVLLTNAHVVRGSGTVLVRAPSGEVLVAQVAGAVHGRDAAVLELTSEDQELLGALALAPAAGVGDELVVVGHPEGHTAAVRGTVRSIERRAGYDGSSDVLLVDAQVRGGSSGGAVLDDEGRVVGLVAAKDPATGWAVAYPIAEVLGRGLGSIPPC